MIKPNSFTVSILLLSILMSCKSNQKSSAEVERKLGSYQSMEYGPVIAESIRMNGPDSSLVRKGLAIRLDHNAAMIFDTDLMRFAGGSLGGWIDISKTDYTSYKGSGIAKIEGRQVFGSSSEFAGWAKNDSFKAQREDGMGNLPDDWAHYKGYFRYGEKVMLSYSVGGVDILEIPESIKYDESVAFIRNIRVASSVQGLRTLILQKHPAWSVTRANDRKIMLNTAEGVLAVMVAGGPDKVRLVESKEGESELIELHIPPSGNSQMIRIAVFQMKSLDGKQPEKFAAAIDSNGMPNFERMKQGGASQWNKSIKTSGILSEDNTGYVIDRITVPSNNPWGSWMRFSGIDFFNDGQRAAISTWNGDVWIVSGIGQRLENMRWRRFASGLFYPMGIAVVDGDIYVTERSQLTRLRDRNGDGEADYYESFNNDGIVYPRALTMGLAVDSEGYFYFFKNGNRVPSEVPQHGALIQVSPDGSSREVYARGFRSANSLGIGPDDTILTADQEGQWVPVDRINVVEEKDGFYGYRPHGGDDLPVGEFQVPVAWLPHTIEKSAGFLTYAGDPRGGPLAGHWIMSSYSQGTLFAILMEKKGGRFQGGIVPLPGIKSQSGVMRADINPDDGQLYMVGLRGWGTTATADGSFERLRYAGDGSTLPEALHVTPGGVEIVFTNPLDPVSARDTQNYELRRWEYIYSKEYGSPPMSLAHPLQKGRDTVKASSAAVSKDGRTVYLKIPNMQSVMQMKIGYNLRFENGQEAKNTIYHTVNWLSEAEANDKPEWQQRITSGLRDTFLERGNANPAENLISENECRTCHTLNKKSVGPSFLEIARKYPQSPGTVEQLLTTVTQGGTGNWGDRAMPPHPNITKKEATKMIQYILSLPKNKSQ